MVAGFVAAAAFSIIYRVPQREVVRCGLVGAGGWLVFSTTRQVGEVGAYFLAAAAVTLISEIFARLRRQPVIVYLIPGVIPLVPGGMAYTTMLSFLQNEYGAGLELLAATFFAAGALAGGITVVSSVFRVYSSSRKVRRQ
jgi:uncharacterized membrane protein YjjB (DUF3815 family)